jgi:hypothetical protein
MTRTNLRDCQVDDGSQAASNEHSPQAGEPLAPRRQDGDAA